MRSIVAVVVALVVLFEQGFQFHYNPFWFRIPAVLREIDVEKLKARIAAP